MGFVKSLQDAQQRVAERSKSEDYSDRVKTVWASLKDDGDAAKLVPLQELDEGSPNYNEKLGKAQFVLTHSNPDNWKKSAECTADEGACFGCEQGWYQKMELLVNVLFDNGKDEPYVAVLSKGTGKGSIGKELMSIASDEDQDNSITDKLYKYVRTGKGTDTSYSLQSLPKGRDKYNLEDYTDKLFDLKEVPFKVKYEKQEAYYLDGQPTKTADAPKSASDVDQDW